jgi:hypothetical protein
MAHSSSSGRGLAFTADDIQYAKRYQEAEIRALCCMMEESRQGLVLMQAAESSARARGRGAGHAEVQTPVNETS